ncbi:MAG TPA: nuclear transport factor 2 family protein [Steroidobacteraceae bacterium]|jgi:ketosteroid isomerase-like protein|nr:nuclear transport factor 2 family protein [Steroidobacteraceae bacterium]
MKWFAGLLALLMWTAGAASDQQEIEQATTHFLTSFENLDMPAFLACFADDATAFFPAPEPPERVTGKAAIRSRFQLVFDAIRKGASAGPPYHRLEPQDLQIQSLSAETAVVSFHLRNSERIARRTLVMKKVRSTWLIAHLHASNLSL